MNQAHLSLHNSARRPVGPCSTPCAWSLRKGRRVRQATAGGEDKGENAYLPVEGLYVCVFINAWVHHCSPWLAPLSIATLHVQSMLLYQFQGELTYQSMIFHMPSQLLPNSTIKNSPSSTNNNSMDQHQLFQVAKRILTVKWRSLPRTSLGYGHWHLASKHSCLTRTDHMDLQYGLSHQIVGEIIWGAQVGFLVVCDNDYRVWVVYGRIKIIEHAQSTLSESIISSRVQPSTQITYSSRTNTLRSSIS
jgi:hypothetical protein